MHHLFYRDVEDNCEENYEEDPDELSQKLLFEDSTPRNSANFFSQIFFLWVNPLISVSLI